jgi:hypothetical protein
MSLGLIFVLAKRVRGKEEKRWRRRGLRLQLVPPRVSKEEEGGALFVHKLSALHEEDPFLDSSFSKVGVPSPNTPNPFPLWFS